MLRRLERAVLGRMGKRRSGILALAAVAALSCTGCVRTGEDQRRERPPTRDHARPPLDRLPRRRRGRDHREAETGGGLFYATGSATVCARFEIHGDNGPRRVTTREIDCPRSVTPSADRVDVTAGP